MDDNSQAFAAGSRHKRTQQFARPFSTAQISLVPSANSFTMRFVVRMSLSKRRGRRQLTQTQFELQKKLQQQMGSCLFSDTSTLPGSRDWTKAADRETVAQRLGIDLQKVPHSAGLCYDQILNTVDSSTIRGLRIIATNPVHSWIHQAVRTNAGEVGFFRRAGYVYDHRNGADGRPLSRSRLG